MSRGYDPEVHRRRSIRSRGFDLLLTIFVNKNDLPDYSVSGESPLGSCHRGGTFDHIVALCSNSGAQ